MGGRGSSSGKGNGKTIYVRKGESVEDAKKRYEKTKEIRIGGAYGSFSESDLKSIEEKGGKRWTKSDKDRMYLGNLAYSVGGLEVSRYSTSQHISGAKLDGELISNSEANAALGLSNIYIDLKTGKLSVENIQSKYSVQRPRELIATRIIDYIKKIRGKPI